MGSPNRNYAQNSHWLKASDAPSEKDGESTVTPNLTTLRRQPSHNPAGSPHRQGRGAGRRQHKFRSTP